MPRVQALVWMSVCVVCALSQEHIPLTMDEETSVTQEVACGEYKYYKVDVVEPCKDLRIRVNHIAGEPDLYVGRGNNKFPTLESLSWTSYEWGSEDLVISSWDPEFDVGTFYIGVHAYCGEDVLTDQTPSRYTILVQSISTTHPHTEITASQPVISGSVEAEAYNYYRFCVPELCNNIKVTLNTCRDPTQCPTSYAYPELLVSRSIVQPKISDHSWKLASGDRQSINLKHDNPDVQVGHYFVGIYGWCTPDEFCNDPSTCGPCTNVPNNQYNISLTMTAVDGCDTVPYTLCDSSDATHGIAMFVPSVVIVTVTSLIIAP